MKVPKLTTSIALLREVLARRASIVAVVTLVLSTAVDSGWIGVDVSNGVMSWINKGFIVASLLVTVLVVRPKVTPVDDPRNNAGQHLVPAPDPATVVAVHDTNGKGNNAEVPLPLD